MTNYRAPRLHVSETAESTSNTDRARLRQRSHPVSMITMMLMMMVMMRRQTLAPAPRASATGPHQGHHAPTAPSRRRLQHGLPSSGHRRPPGGDTRRKARRAFRLSLHPSGCRHTRPAPLRAIPTAAVHSAEPPAHPTPTPDGRRQGEPAGCQCWLPVSPSLSATTSVPKLEPQNPPKTPPPSCQLTVAFNDPKTRPHHGN